MSFSIHDLDKIIAERAGADVAKSYTKSLIEGGVERAGKKFGEEAFEAVIAAVSGDRAALTAEAADVLYHLLVLLRVGGVTLDEVIAVLESRTAMSGLDEKASRKS